MGKYQEDIRRRRAAKLEYQRRQELLRRQLQRSYEEEIIRRRELQARRMRRQAQLRFYDEDIMYRQHEEALATAAQKQKQEADVADEELKQSQKQQKCDANELRFMDPKSAEEGIVSSALEQVAQPAEKKKSLTQQSNITVLVEDASDSEYEEDEKEAIWRNRHPSPGQWMEPVFGFN